jgi:hypothetical protein
VANAARRRALLARAEARMVWVELDGQAEVGMLYQVERLRRVEQQDARAQPWAELDALRRLDAEARELAAAARDLATLALMGTGPRGVCSPPVRPAGRPA